MKQIQRLTWLAGGLLLPLAVLLPGPSSEPGDPVEGQRLFVEKGCVRCHSVRGAGGRIGPDLGRKASAGSYYEIAALMWNHSEGMSEKIAGYRMSRPVFEDDELSDLVYFLYFLNYFDEPGDARSGRLLFREKHCIRCHEVGDEGGGPGPPLDTIPRGTSPLRIAAALWNHGPAMISAIEEAGLDVPTFEGSEIIDLFAFVRSQGERGGGHRFQSAGDPERGAEAFESKGCIACHEMFGDGSAIGPDLGRMELRGSVTQIAGRMWNHWPEMARTMEQAGMTVPEFEENDLLDLFAYIYTARYSALRGDPAAGRSVFTSKGCVVCHDASGADQVGPSLQELTTGRPVESIMQAMWNHAPAMNAQLAGQNLSTVRLGAEELADLLAFLTSDWATSEEPGGG